MLKASKGDAEALKKFSVQPLFSRVSVVDTIQEKAHHEDTEGLRDSTEK